MKRKLWKKATILTILCFLLINTNYMIIKSEPESYEYSIVLDNISYEFIPLTVEDNAYTKILVENQGFTQNIGQAQLPIFRYYVQLPFGNNPEITINKESWTSTSLSEKQLPELVIPTQPSQMKDEPEKEFCYNDSFYRSESFQPNDWITISDIGFIRGRRCALVEIIPVQYKPDTGELHLLESCQLEITVDNVDFVKTNAELERYDTLGFSQLSKIILLNTNDFSLQTRNDDNEGYLIITPDEYYPQLVPFIQWKQDQGFTVTSINTSSIPNANTTTGISIVIQDAYDNWTNPPVYVLLIGDVSEIPTFVGTTGYPGPADAVDLYYVTVNGTDYFPDMFIGRFSVSDAAELNAIINKTIYYEKGQFSNESWVKNASFLAGNDHHTVTEGTHNFVINMYLDSHGFLSDKLYEDTYGATSDDVRDAINDGRGLVVFSGHGNTYYWGDGPAFYQTDVENLLNLNHYPVIFSHACDTGQFNYGECFAETWIRQDQKGAVAFIAASESTLWPEDDILERRIFEGWWNESIDNLKGVLDYGLYELYQYYGGTGNSKYYFESYNLLGDPSLQIWRDKPSTYNNPPIIHNVTIDPLIQEPNGYVNISCIISDEKLPVNVTVQLQYPNSTIDYISMQKIGNDTNPELVSYYYNASYTEFGTYDVSILATDVKGLINVSESFSFLIASIEPVTSLIHGWNFISSPINGSFSKYDFNVLYNDTYQDWNESCQQLIISPTVFSWNRETQSYGFASDLQSGYGYWLYAHFNCSLYILVQQKMNATPTFHNPLHSYWNTIGIINDSIIPKQSLMVNWNSTTYGWTDAVNESLLSAYVFGWNRNSNSYEFSNDFYPGFSYWLYAYEPITLSQQLSLR
jgi:hypothetical protein